MLDSSSLEHAAWLEADKEADRRSAAREREREYRKLWPLVLQQAAARRAREKTQLEPASGASRASRSPDYSGLLANIWVIHPVFSPGLYTRRASEPAPGSAASEPPRARSAYERLAASTGAVHWHASEIALPSSVRQLFADDAQRGVLCEFCAHGQNLVFGAAGEIAGALCPCCCAKIGSLPANRCPGGGPDCETLRFVDKLGSVSELCRACHSRWGAENARARPRRGGRKASRASRADTRGGARPR